MWTNPNGQVQLIYTGRKRGKGIMLHVHGMSVKHTIHTWFKMESHSTHMICEGIILQTHGLTKRIIQYTFCIRGNHTTQMVEE